MAVLNILRKRKYIKDILTVPMQQLSMQYIALLTVKSFLHQISQSCTLQIVALGTANINILKILSKQLYKFIFYSIFRIRSPTHQ